MIVSFLVFSLPYLVFIKSETGKWLLTMKRNLSQTKIVRMQKNQGRDLLIKESMDKTNSGVEMDKQTVVNKTNINVLSKDSKLNKSGTVIEDVTDGKLIEESVSKTSSVVSTNKQTVVNKTDINRLSKDPEHKKFGTEREGVTNVKFIKKPFKGQSLKTYLQSLLYVITKYISTFHLFVFMFFIIGVINWTRIKKVRFFGFYISTVIVLYMAILYRLNIVNIAEYNDIHQYPSRRHVMPIIIPAIFCAGLGVHSVGTWML